MKSDDRLRLVTTAIFTIVALSLGVKPLADPDLGWHLAGGLWMLEHRRLLSADPLGALGSPWLSYSWLFEIVIALLYEAGGFKALQCAQALLIAATAALLSWSITARSDSIGQSSPPPLAGLVALALVLQLTVPIWQLRPQLISLFLFLALLHWGRRYSFPLLPTVLLTALWANIHVFWILVPATVIAESVGSVRRFRRGAFIALCCTAAAACNPYGLKLHAAILQYGFEHSRSYALIKEFRPLSSDHGIALVAFIVVVGLLVMRIRSLKARLGAGPLLTAGGLAVCAVLQVKYLPLFGAAAGRLLTFALGPVCAPTKTATALPAGRHWHASIPAAIVTLAFLGLCAKAMEPHPVVGERQAQALLAAEKLSTRVAPGKHCIVLNHFNDGGWLALGFWLARGSDAREAVLKTAIDGRTLVMGEQRISEYYDLITLQPNAAEVLASWGIGAVALPKELKLSRQFIEKVDWESSAGPPEWIVSLSPTCESAAASR